MFQGPAHRRGSLASVRGTYGNRREESAVYQHSPPVDGFHRARPLRLARLQLLQTKLILLFTDLFPVPFACECFLHAFLFAWFQVKGVALDLFNDVLRLHLPLETTKSILQGLAFLNTNFCQDEIHLQTCQIGYLISISPLCVFRTHKIVPTHQKQRPTPSPPGDIQAPNTSASALTARRQSGTPRLQPWVSYRRAKGPTLLPQAGVQPQAKRLNCLPPHPHPSNPKPRKAPRRPRRTAKPPAVRAGPQDSILIP
jgi:hypothetical protein